jgi:O-antigen ligase
MLAPGSAAIWHPAEATAADVLGPGRRPLSIDPGATERSLGFALGLLGLVLVSQPALVDRRLARRLVIVAVVAGLAVALYGITARAFFGPLLFGRFAVPTVSPFGPFVSKNHFAGYVEMAALLAAGLALGLADEARRGPAALSWVGSARAWRVVLAAGAAAVMSLAVLVSLSRGGALSLLAGFGAVAAMQLWRRRASWPRLFAGLAGVFLVLLAGLAVLPPEGRARIASIAHAAEDSSASFRMALWSDAVRAAAASPMVGFGFGAFASALPVYKSAAGSLRVEHTENDYLELLAETGFLGASLLLAGMALTAVNLVRGLGRQEDRLLRGLGTGAAGALAALLVHSVFDFNLHVPSNALLFALSATVGLAAAAGPSPRTRPVEGALLIAALVAATVAAAAPLPSTVGALPGVRRAVAAGGADSGLRLSAAEAELQARLHRQPADPQAWLYLAWVRAARGSAGEATGLAAYAVSLDPRHEGLRREAERLQAERHSGRLQDTP